MIQAKLYYLVNAYYGKEQPYNSHSNIVQVRFDISLTQSIISE